MLWQRLLFGSLMIVALVGLVWLDARVSGPGRGVARMLPALPGPADRAAIPTLPRLAPASDDLPATAGLPITLLVVVLAVFASIELGRLIRGGPGPLDAPQVAASPTGYEPVVAWAVVISAGLAFLPWVELQVRLGRMGEARLVELVNYGLSPTLMWLGGGFLGTALLVLARRTTERAVGNMAATLFILCYIGLLASFAVRVRTIWPGAAGAGLLVYWVMTVKCSDIGAYFTGRAIGRHKLAPWLSPGKTVEGAFGAILGSILFAAGGLALWSHLSPTLGPAPLSYAQAVIFGAVIAVSGHLGDLVESAIKRDVGSKDSARVVPAFGGLLDILDSPLFTAPIAWWLLTFWTRMD